MKPKSMIGALVVALLFGCAAPRVGYDHAKGQGPPSIAVYRDGKEPTRPYRAIAEFVHRDGYGKEVNAVTEMVSRAKAIGADALILQPRQEETFVVGVEDYNFLWKGTAVVYQ